MARPKKDVPTYRYHKPRNCGKVVIDGHPIYFPGGYNSPESKAAYQRFLAEYLATGKIPTSCGDSSETTIGELVRAFIERFVRRRYVKHGKPTSEQRSFTVALKPLSARYMDLLTSEFEPKHLLRCREDLIAAGYTRKRINQHVVRIRRAFQWGVVEGLVPETVWRALLAVEGLRRGDGGKEPAKVMPVPEDRIAAIEKYVTPPIWAMVQLQLWTGARPGEVCQMRTVDIQESDPVLPAEVQGVCWVYRPGSHKTEHHNKDRLILLGPQARKILEPWLRPDDPEAFLFSPAEAKEWHLRKRKAAAKSHRRNFTRKANPRRAPTASYTVSAYGHAIRKACEKAFDMPADLRRIPKDATDEAKADLKAQAAQWRAANCWHPHQLRHNAATRIRAAFGLELARVILGHSSAVTSEIYAEADLVKAVHAMARLG